MRAAASCAPCRQARRRCSYGDDANGTKACSRCIEKYGGGDDGEARAHCIAEPRKRPRPGLKRQRRDASPSLLGNVDHFLAAARPSRHAESLESLETRFPSRRSVVLLK